MEKTVSQFDPTRLQLSPEQAALYAAAEAMPQKRVPPDVERRRREHFGKVPWSWFERLDGASGCTCRVAMYVLYRHWKGKGQPVKLANGDSADAKTRALRDLEERGLVSVERHPQKSPVVTVHSL
jgi:hypothetical protein